jgi:hypothetical protein
MRFQRRRAPTARFGGGAPELHKPLHPPHRRTHAHLEPFRRLAPRRSRLDALHYPRLQVQRIALDIDRLQKAESMSKDSRIPESLGIPPIRSFPKDAHELDPRDIRDVHDPINDEGKPQTDRVPLKNTPHEAAQPGAAVRPEPDLPQPEPSLPEGLRRPRTGPYGPTKGRA